MNENQNVENTKNSVLIIVSIIILISALIVGSLAIVNSPRSKTTYFSTLKLDEEAYGNTTFDTSNLNFKTILDKNVKTSLNNVIHITFRVGGNKENNTEEPSYDIALQDLEVDCNLLSPYVKWQLIKNGEVLSEGSLDYKFDTIKDGRLVLTPIQQDLIEYNEDKTKYDYYEFYLWLSDSCQEEDITKCQNVETQNNLLNKTISGKIEVELYGQTKDELVREPSETLDTSTCVTDLKKEIDSKDEENTKEKTKTENKENN